MLNKTRTVATPSARSLSLVAVGTAMSGLLAVSYLLCVAFGLLLPGWAMYQSWQQFLPGFTWLTWPSFLLGLVESVAYGWYIALIYVPLFNLAARR